MNKITGIHLKSLTADDVDYTASLVEYKDANGEWKPMDTLFDRYYTPPVDPDPIKLDEGEVVVLIKTNDGDLYLKFKGE